MLGDLLRQERVKKGLSLKDVENATHIRTIYLEAIENDEYDKLPEKVYVNGFIKIYTKFLGLDEKEFIPSFDNNDDSQLKLEEHCNNNEIFTQIRKNQHKNRLAILLFLVLFGIGSTWYLLKNFEQSDIQGQLSNANQPLETGQTINNSSTIKANFCGRCWIKVTLDGKVVLERTILSGESLSWNYEHQIIFRIGNAGAVEFIQDDEYIGALGSEGEVIDKTFTRD